MHLNKTLAIAWILNLIFSTTSAFAGDQALIDLGIAMYGGSTGKSLGGSGTASTGFFVHFQAQSRKGPFRPNVGSRIELGSGTASVGSDKPSFTIWSGEISPGIELLPFKTSYVAPFIGLSGILGWSALTTTTTTQALTFGYSISAGAEIRKKANPDAQAIRLMTSYRSLSGKLANTAGFQLNAVLFSIGMVF